MIRKATVATGCLACLIFVFLQPQSSTAWVIEGFSFFIDRLFPSLFLPMVITGFLCSSPLGIGLGRLIHPLFSTLFRTNPSEGPALLFGFVCGYPTGLLLAKDLLDRGQISATRYRRLSLFCNNCGLGFLFSFLSSLFSPSVALCLFLAQLCSCVALSRLSLPIFPPDTAHIRATPPNRSYLSAFLCSLKRSIVSLSYIGGFVIFFTFLSRFLCRILLQGETPFLSVGVYSLLELSGACLQIHHAGLSPVFCAAAMGWGGLCVWAQSCMVCESVPLGGVYLLFKLTNSLLCTIFYLFFSCILL